MRKIRIIWFWIVAFNIIVWNVLRGKEWHMVMVDYEVGEENGVPVRRRMRAWKRCGSLDIERW